MATRAPHVAVVLGAAAVVVALDQCTKQLALTHLADGPIDLVGSLRLNLVFNDSAAFSLGGGRTSWIALLALGVTAVLLRMGLRAPRRSAAAGYGIIVGGAAGNLVDRFLRDGDGLLGGRVVDMVDLQWWPVFNLADAALWVGIGVLLVAQRHVADPADPADPADAADPGVPAGSS